MPIIDEKPLRSSIHQYSANYHHQHSCENDEAGINKQLELWYIKPVTDPKRRIKINKQKGKHCRENDKAYNVPFLNNIPWKFTL